jgi:hypothetical protein
MKSAPGEAKVNLSAEQQRQQVAGRHLDHYEIRAPNGDDGKGKNQVTKKRRSCKHAALYHKGLEREPPAASPAPKRQARNSSSMSSVRVR